MNPDEIEDSGDSVAWSDSSEIWLDSVDTPNSERTCDCNLYDILKLPLRYPRQFTMRLSKQSYTAWHDSHEHDTPPRPRTRWTALEIE